MTTVIATRRGMIGGKFIEPGTVFDIDAKKVSKRWMAKKGTPEFKAAQAAANAPDTIDHLTGERVAAGGLPEQIAVLQEDRDRLSQKVTALEARIAELLDDRSADKEPEEVKDVDEIAAPTEEVDQAPVTERRSRRIKKE